MTHKLKLITGLFLLCMACSNENETASGLKFTVLRKGDGLKLDSGKYLILNMVFKDGKDSVWNDTEKNGVPAIIQIQEGVPKGDAVLEAVMMMSKGDSITFKIPAKSLFENTFRSPLPFSVDSTSLFTFNLGLSDVLDAEQFQQLQEKMIAKQNEDFVKQQEGQLLIDIDIIDKHLAEKGITAQKLESGIRYKISKAGKGENAKSGQTASIYYAGYLLNGKLFDSNIESVARLNNVYQEGQPYKPYDVVVDGQEVIKGWEEAIKVMNKGSKMTVYIPSTLAYGSRRRSAEIVENTILMFEMELVDIK
ncbi:MAG: FKBP-type peptidyl-prolyl cis-trans isomerase [Bacteroidia bacterium]|nr:FKBP-type peptidyl-prolyl cis-trans isomerase [Bacteroidia bacterium]